MVDEEEILRHGDAAGFVLPALGCVKKLETFSCADRRRIAFDGVMQEPVEGTGGDGSGGGRDDHPHHGQDQL